MSVAELVHQSQRSAIVSAGTPSHHTAAHQPAGGMPANAGHGHVTGQKNAPSSRIMASQQPPVYAPRSSASSQSQRDPSHAHYLTGDPSFPPLHAAAAVYHPQPHQQQYNTSSHAQSITRDSRGGTAGRGYSPAADLYGMMRG